MTDTITKYRDNVVTTANLGASLGLNFKLKTSTLIENAETSAKYTDVYVVVTKEVYGGENDVVTVSGDDINDDGTNVVFSYKNIAAKEMVNPISFRCFGTNSKDQVILISEYSTSIAKFISSSYAKVTGTEENKLKNYRLLSDIANYGTAAQKYFDYNTDNLANDYGVIPNYASYITETIVPTADMIIDVNKTGTDAAKTKWTTIATLGDVIAPVVRFRYVNEADYNAVKDDIYLRISYVDGTGETQYRDYEVSDFEVQKVGSITWQAVVFDKLNSRMLGTAFKAEILRKSTGEQLSAANYSLTSQFAKQYPTDLSTEKNKNIATIISCMLAYSKSADAVLG